MSDSQSPPGIAKTLLCQAKLGSDPNGTAVPLAYGFRWTPYWGPPACSCMLLAPDPAGTAGSAWTCVLLPVWPDPAGTAGPFMALSVVGACVQELRFGTAGP